MKEPASFEVRLPARPNLLSRLEGLLAAVRSRPALALADQAVVSATNFATTILVGRFCGEELGLYALGFSLVLLGLCLQQSLVSAPYMVFSPRVADENRPTYAGAVLIHQALLSLLVFAAFLVAALVADPASPFGGLLSVLSVAAPCVLLREFVRRFLLARLEVGQALAINVAVSLLQLAALSALAAAGLLHAWAAHLVAGAACLIAGTLWLLHGRARFSLHGARARQEWSRSWTLGRWVLAGNAATLTQAYLMHWVLLAYLGSGATGLFAASATVVDFSNLLVLGLANIAGPQMARALADYGRRGLRREVARFLLLLGSLMAAFCLAMVFLGDWAVVQLFGPDYAGQGQTVLVLACGTLLYALGLGAANGLLALEKARVNFAGSFVGLALSMGSALVLVPASANYGAAWCYFIGAAASAAIRLLAFWRLSRPAVEEAP